MANEEHLTRLRQGVAAWNQWRVVKSPPIWPDLSEADLAGAHLTGANFARANLSGAHLAGAHLPRANLSGAHLIGADLAGANLTGADLAEAHLIGADLAGVNLHEAVMGWATLVNIDLSTARGLETVQHEGPSTISIDTLYLSDGKIPESFLRGAGVPDAMIIYMKSLVGRPFEFYSCFISYSHADQSFARRLYDQLQGCGIRCWLDEHQLLPGDDIKSLARNSQMLKSSGFRI